MKKTCSASEKYSAWKWAGLCASFFARDVIYTSRVYAIRCQCPSVCDGSALWSRCMPGTQRLRQLAKLKPSYDPQQTWPTPMEGSSRAMLATARPSFFRMTLRVTYQIAPPRDATRLAAYMEQNIVNAMSMSVCLSVRPHISGNTTIKLLPNFFPGICLCYPWPHLGPPLVTLWYGTHTFVFRRWTSNNYSCLVDFIRKRHCGRSLLYTIDFLVDFDERLCLICSLRATALRVSPTAALYKVSLSGQWLVTWLQWSLPNCTLLDRYTVSDVTIDSVIALSTY